eukprot:gene658-1270_t
MGAITFFFGLSLTVSFKTSMGHRLSSNISITISHEDNSRKLTQAFPFESKTRRKKHSGGAKRISKSQAMARAVHNIEVGMELYHRWWTGPAHETSNVFSIAKWSSAHRRDENAIFTTALVDSIAGDNTTPTMLSDGMSLFLGSCRKFFLGDIVVAIRPTAITAEIQALFTRNAVVVYEISDDICYPTDTNTNTDTPTQTQTQTLTCGSKDERIPSEVFSHYFFQWWAMQYGNNSHILYVDYRYTFFQSNPFDHQQQQQPHHSHSHSHQSSFDWRVEHPLVLFAHFQPNSVLQRCTNTSRLFSECYGQEALRKYGHKVTISGSVFLGSRDGVLLWSHYVTQELQEAPGRHEDNVCTSQDIYVSMAMWLVFSNKMKPFMNVGLVPQGEGVVNVLDALYTHSQSRLQIRLQSQSRHARRHHYHLQCDSPLQGSLHSFWNVLDSAGWIRNWNRDISPVVIYSEALVNELNQLLTQTGDQLWWHALAVNK